MNNFKSLCFIALFGFLGYNSFAQENKPAKNQEAVQTTFSVEINADTTLDDLKKIEQMLKDDYNVTVNFENVKIVDEKIVSIRMQLVNGNQSFMKSIDNVNRPIDPFSINLTGDNGKHYVSVKGNSERSPLNFFGSDAFSAFDSLSENTQSLQSDFLNLNSEMKKIYEEMMDSQKRFQELFKNFSEEADRTSEDLKSDSDPKNENQSK